MSIEDDATNAISRSLAEIIEKSVKGVAGNARSGVELLTAKYSIGFERYITTTLSRTNRAKTLITGNEPISLDKTYEPVDFRLGDSVVDVDTFLNRMADSDRHALITAMLGAGKSFTMRHIYRKVYERKGALGIPVFIELRDVNFESSTVVDSLYEGFEHFHVFLSRDAVIKCLKSGAFFILLDGFDEIKLQHKKKAQKEILDIARNYPETRLIVSSRKDISRFMSWHSFPEYQIEPLDAKKLNNLINKIPYNEDEKKSFLGAVNSNLFNTHRRLLSNPLLASMMLLTFKEFQEIPSKMHVFYGVAFEVLFRRHDSIKTDYKRDFASGLDMDTFKRLFMTFCFMSYIDREFTFKDGGHLTYLTNAAVYEEINAGADNLDDDIRNNICIMVQEGEQVDFIHRSFQEYFCSLFLSRRSIDQSYEFIDRLFYNYENHSNTVPMLIEIDKEEFERKYLLDKLESISNRLENSVDWKAQLRVFCDKFAFGKFGTEENPEQLICVSGVIWKTGGGSKGSVLIDLISKTEGHYLWPSYSVERYAKPLWQEALPKKYKGRDDIRIISPEDMTKKFYTAVGLERYMIDLKKALLELRQELSLKHGQKKTILQNVLKSASLLNGRNRGAAR